MNKRHWLLCAVLLTAALPGPGAEAGPDANSNLVESVRRQVLADLKPMIEQEVQHRVDAALAARTNAIEREVQQRVDAALAAARANAAPTVAAGPANGSPWDQLRQLNDKVDQVVEAQKKVLPSEFNPSIGVVGDTVFSYRNKKADEIGSERPGGFDVSRRALELNLAASVDSFTKAWAVLNASADSDTGESNLGVEEAAVQTTSLPGNLTLTAGRFFGEFGKLANIHDHELPFVNRPLVLDRYIGGESRSDGAQLNWLLPLPQYVSLTAGLGNGFGGDVPSHAGDYRPFGGLSAWSRLSTAFDLSPNWQAEMGLSGMVNQREQDRGGALEQPDGSTLTEQRRRLEGLDFKLTYLPLRNNPFESFTWGSELLHSDNRYLADPDATPDSGDEFDDDVGSYGLYSYAAYRWSRQWSAGFLYDWLEEATDNSAKTAAYSPFLAYNMSHWGQLRLQYTHTEPDEATGLKADDAVYLQWCWIIGSHSHGWQQR